MYSEDYRLCKVCQTLVWVGKPELGDLSRPSNEDDYYGRRYWFEHQEQELGLPNIEQRARDDLHERCLYWLEMTLKYRLPPAKVLDIGSSHGGFVALLRNAGYEASGLEISPWIAKYAQDLFQIPMFIGPIEDQKIPPASLDMIVLLDVLEHLVDPEQTLKHCLNLLTDDGVLMIQTPCYPPEEYQELQGRDHLFLRMLIPKEHIHLFSKNSMRLLFEKFGVQHIKFLPAYYADQDMFFVASREPLKVWDNNRIEERLLSTANGRITMALLDLHSKMTQVQAELVLLKNDRSEHLRIIDELNQQLRIVEEDRSARLALIHQLSDQLERVEADRAARLDLINRLNDQLQLSEMDRGASLERINQLNEELGDLKKLIGDTSP